MLLCLVSRSPCREEPHSRCGEGNHAVYTTPGFLGMLQRAMETASIWGLACPPQGQGCSHCAPMPWPLNTEKAFWTPLTANAGGTEILGRSGHGVIFVDFCPSLGDPVLLANFPWVSWVSACRRHIGTFSPGSFSSTLEEWTALEDRDTQCLPSERRACRLTTCYQRFEFQKLKALLL